MTENRIDDLSPELRELLSADRQLPPVPAELRTRLAERLDQERDDRKTWRGAAEVVELPRAGSRWRRRAVIGVLIAAAAAVVFALTLGGTSNHERTADDTAMERHQTEPPLRRATVPNKPAGTPSVRTTARAKALGLQLADHSAHQRKVDLHRFVAGDAAATRFGIKVSRDNWHAGGRVMQDSFIQARDGMGPCSYRSGLGALTTRNACKLSGKELLDGYLRALFKRQPKLAPGPKHELLLEQVSDPRGNFWRTHYVFRNVEIDGNDVARASVVRNPTTNMSEVLLVLHSGARNHLGRITAGNIGTRLLIIVNGQVTSSPIIQSAIPGGRATITLGNQDPARAQKEARALVRSLGSARP